MSLKAKLIVCLICLAPFGAMFEAHAADRVSETEPKHWADRMYAAVAASRVMSINGGMSAYNSWQPGLDTPPGTFQQANFQADHVTPLQFSIGKAVTSNLRVDASYTRYGAVSVLDHAAFSALGNNFTSGGGDVSSDAMMLNFYYSLDRLTGRFLYDRLSLYVGAGAGMARNEIADYYISDMTRTPGPGSWGPGTTPPAGTLIAENGPLTQHPGATTRDFAYMFEGGVTLDLDRGMELDFFMRWANLGRVQTSGTITTVIQDTVATGLPYGANNWQQTVVVDAENYYGWQAGGIMQILDMGVRLRIGF